MPSVGRIKQLSVLGVAIAALGISANSASAANDVWLWACHGPSGQALDTGPFVDNTIFDGQLFVYGDECSDEPSGGLGGGGISAVLTEQTSQGVNQPARGGSEASVRLDLPPGLKLSKVKLQRQTRGFSGAQQLGNKQVYKVVAGTGDATRTLERVSLEDAAPANLDGEVTLDAPTPAGASGDSVTVAVRCENAINVNCPASAPVEADVARAGLMVSDTSAPKMAVGGTRNPAAKFLDLDIAASDEGSGLRSVIAYLANTGAPVSRYDFPGCTDLTPSDETADLPLDADCTMVGSVPFDPPPPDPNAKSLLRVDTTLVNDGDHLLVVRLVDWAGNADERHIPVQVLNHVDLGKDTQTLNIGTSGTTQQGSGGTGTGTGGGVAGASTQNCNSPRLSMSLSQRPMRISKGVAVLQTGKRYRFRGRLTCVINGKRRSAPKRARIDILNTVGKKTVEKAGTTVRDKGNLTVILAYKSSRTLTFRFTNTNGQRSQVRIKIKVAKKKS